MGDPWQTIEDVEEELTVQRVLLDSLEDDNFEGADQEKKDLRREIKQLEARLEHMRSDPEWAWEQTVDSSGYDDDASIASGGGQSLASFEPMAATPQKNRSGQATPASVSLPSRKRDLDATPRGPRSKSRRTAPMDDDFLSSDPMEIIDLTGEDVIPDATAVAGRIRAEEDAVPDDIAMPGRRRAQQWKAESHRGQMEADYALALRLSQEDNDVPSSTSNPHETNAFTKIMASQQLNSYRSPGTSSSVDAKPLPPFHSAPATMPGAYPGALPDPFNSRPNPAALYMPTSSPGFGRSPAMPGTPWQSSTGMSLGSPASADAWRHPGPTKQQPGALSDVISKTGSYDFVNMVDSLGNPLDPRMVNHLADLQDEPFKQEELDELLKNIRPDDDPSSVGNTPRQLKEPLYRHQEIALTWMQQMEDGSNKGGILADDMGLGKTITTLALMHSRAPTSRPRTNLIVAPLSLVRQWEEEIKKKTKVLTRLSVFVYHNCKASASDLARYDVVLTTYGTIAQELRKLDEFEKECSKSSRTINYNDPKLAYKCPILHPTHANFHRVILDEAQCIKNRLTKTAMACYKINTKYRWCLTGTPMMNTIEELYSLIHFLRIRPYSNWTTFSQTFGKLLGKKGADTKSVAMEKLRALIKAVMMRRMKNSILDGKPIVQLPPKHEEVVYAELSQEERAFYTQLEKKSQVQLSKYLREGTVGKNYSQILVLLLRLRQACCHPHLNLDVEEVSPVTDTKVLDLVKTLAPSIVRRIKDADGFQCPICFDAVQAPAFVFPCGHDTCKPCLSRVVDSAVTQNLQNGEESSGTTCPMCRTKFDPDKCFSHEAFRTVHMPETMDFGDGELTYDTDSDYDSGDDGGVIDDDVDDKGNLRDFIVDDEDGQGAAPRKASSSPKKNRKGRKGQVRPTMLKALRHEAIKNIKAHKKYMNYLRRHWLPSAKVTECLKLIKSIQETGEKTIVFSQWTLLLDLLEVAIKKEKLDLEALRYDGSMSGNERSGAAAKFRDSKRAKVMLVSLRAGNAGLNLTSASRVIIMDPFWNPYIEMQAVDRAYRIGQQQEVKVYRILTEQTVEDRIVALQERKKEMVEAALDEAASMKIGRLTTRELRFLFNQN